MNHAPYAPRTSQGGIRLALLFLLGMLALLWAGGQGIYTALSNRQPMTLSYDDYLKSKPKALWLRLTNCHLALPDGAYATRMDVPVEAYAPVHSSTESDDATTHVLLSTKAPDLMSAVREMQAIQRGRDLAAYVQSNRDRLYPSKDAEGLVRYGIDLDSSERSKLASLDRSLAPDFIILDEGKRPEMGTSLGLLLTGLALGALAVKFWSSNSSDEIPE